VSDRHRTRSSGDHRSFRLAIAAAVVLVLAMTLTFEPPWLFRRAASELDGTESLLLSRALNVALFVPLGAVIGSRLRPRWLWLVLGLSAMVELAQLALEDRNPDLLDIVTNSAGGVLGFLAARRWTRRRRSRDLGRDARDPNHAAPPR
jgi:glycopeptide antibiotics resistance protein